MTLLSPPDDHPETGPVRRAATALTQQFGDPPDLAIVLGSGLTPVEDALSGSTRVSSAELSLPVSTVSGHEGAVVVGKIGAARVAVMSGRVHRYEGRSPAEVVRSIRALHAWGVRRLLLTCSAGSVHAHWVPGTLVRIVDHLDLAAAGEVLEGQAYGTRFPDPSGLYTGPLGTILGAAAADLGIRLEDGVYAAMRGPAYETAAEIRMVRTLGGDLVGMSTVPEALAAVALGMDVAALGVVSNLATGVGMGDIDHDAVTTVAGQAAQHVARLVRAIS